MEQPELITSLGDPAVQRIADVMKHSRSNIRTMLVEDPEPVVQCLNSQVKFHEVYTIAGQDPEPEVLEAAARRDVPVRSLAPEVVNRLFKDTRRARTFGVASVPPAPRLADLAGSDRDVVILDGVRITGNMGAIIRSATALGAAGVVLVDSGIESLADRRLLRASRGYVFSLPVVLADADEVNRFVTEQELTLCTFDSHGDHDVAALRSRDERLALLMGSEKTGPSAQLADAADTTVSIPMLSAAESLNVSVAGGIALYERSERNLKLAL